MLEKLLLVLIGVLFSSLAYFVKRRIERRGTIDALDRQQRILAVNKSMKEQGLTLKDMELLESVLSGKNDALARHTKELKHEAKPLMKREEGEFLSQAELSLRADANYQIAKANIDKTVTELSFKLDDVERSALYEAQEQWETYRDKQAEAESITYRGGSIYPMIFMNELESLTVERTARLQVKLDESKGVKS